MKLSVAYTRIYIHIYLCVRVMCVCVCVCRIIKNIYFQTLEVIRNEHVFPKYCNMLNKHCNYFSTIKFKKALGFRKFQRIMIYADFVFAPHVINSVFYKAAINILLNANIP
jgi:hypothetical protein